jgi:hypothetical protein
MRQKFHARASGGEWRFKSVENNFQSHQQEKHRPQKF